MTNLRSIRGEKVKPVTEVVTYGVNFVNSRAVYVEADNYFYSEGMDMLIFLKEGKQVLAVPFHRVQYIDVVI